jgi:hypothetical protein
MSGSIKPRYLTAWFTVIHYSRLSAQGARAFNDHPQSFPECPSWRQTNSSR